jgi:lycopene cyclase domain-containing protein
MKYSRFLLLFVVPIVVVSAILAIPRMTRREWAGIILLPILAVVWTTPWDNYLVANGVWRYDSKKVWNVILGYVPLEEYLFFVLQTLAVAFPTLLVLRRMRDSERAGERPPAPVS